MAAATVFALSPPFLRFPIVSSSSSESPIPRPASSAPARRRLAVSTDLEAPLSSATSDDGGGVSARSRWGREGEKTTPPWAMAEEDIPERERYGLKEYFEQAKEMIRSDGGGGGPRWFSPLDCGSRLENSPLLLFLPGIDGVGVGLIRHHQRLGKIFDVWCLHIPVRDPTSFTDLVKLVEETVQSENDRLPNRPIYLVGESLGGCLALAVAARNPHIDLALIIANPATSFSKSRLEPLLPLLEVMPEQPNLGLVLMLSLTRGDPLSVVISSVGQGLPLQQISRNVPLDPTTISAYLSVLNDMLPKETLLWRLKMLKNASAFANSRLHSVKAQTLILSSGSDHFLPSKEEGERLFHSLLNSDIRRFSDKGHFLFMDEGFDLVTVIKNTRFYRRRNCTDHVSDYVLPTPSEAKAVYDQNSWIEMATDAVMLSTLEDGKIVRGLDGIPSEGPVLLVGYHMLLGLEIYPLVLRFFFEKNILVRGIAHPLLFIKKKNGYLPSGAQFDTFRMMGAVPVSSANLYKLLSSKSHVLLYPGGMREALHRKGEEYRLFWPEQPEFVRMATRFGAKIIPFGAVGEDDICDLVFDYNDMKKIPFYDDFVEQLTNESCRLRTDVKGEVANQQVYMPGILPKVPGRFYIHFGKPIDTAERMQELKDRAKCDELYKQVQSEVETCMAYLREKREGDPYRSLFSRMIYRAVNGITSEVPTFDYD